MNQIISITTQAGKLEKAKEKETCEFLSSENSQQTNSAALRSALNVKPES